MTHNKQQTHTTNTLIMLNPLKLPEIVITDITFPPQNREITIQWISIIKTYCAIQQMDIYLVAGIIHPPHNWSLLYKKIDASYRVKGLMRHLL